MMECGVRLDKVLIDRLDKDVFYARLFIETKEGRKVLDCRPSDAVALALRKKAPILIAEELLEGADEEHSDIHLIEQNNLEEQLNLAVEEERYEDAACLRDQIRSLTEVS